MITNKKDSTIRIVRGEDKFAGAVNQDLGIKINLEKTQKNLIENNVSDILNLELLVRLQIFLIIQLVDKQVTHLLEITYIIQTQKML